MADPGERSADRVLREALLVQLSETISVVGEVKDSIHKVEIAVTELRAKIDTAHHADGTAAGIISDHEDRLRDMEKTTVKTDTLKEHGDRLRTMETALAQIEMAKLKSEHDELRGAYHRLLGMNALIGFFGVVLSILGSLYAVVHR